MTRLTAVAASAASDKVCALLDSGYLRIYTGTRPTRPADDPTALLVELRFQAPAFKPAVDGQATAHSLIPGTVRTDGVASWFAAVEADGVTLVFDGIVGRASADLILQDVLFPAGTELRIDSFAYSQGRN